MAVLGADGDPLVGELCEAGARAVAHRDLSALAAARALAADGEDPAPAATGEAVLLELRPAGRSADVAADAHEVARAVLAAVQAWLADERFAADRLAIVTHRAVATRADEGVEDLAAAVAWGLVRSVQLESPGRLVLIDLDDSDASRRGLPAALAGDESQLALRGGAVLVPRMRAAAPPPSGRVWRSTPIARR